MAEAARSGVFENAGRRLAGLTVTPVPATLRFNLRARGVAVEAAGRAFGVALPVEACQAAAGAERTALWLGPDEWLLLAPEAALPAILDSFRLGLPHSLVDVSHRLAGLELSGEAVETVLNAFCPLDLHLGSFPVGMVTRTVFAKAEIVLWRLAHDRFRLEVARSFGTYVLALIEEAAHGLAP